MINRPQPVAAIRRLAVLLLCLSSLPGCLTRALWQSETELVTRSELLSESSQRSDGRLGLTSSGVVWRGEDGDETWARLDRPGGDLAMAVLARPGLCEVLKATLERMRVTLDAELVEESAHLAWVVRLRKIAIGQVVDAAQLTPEVRGLLASGAMVDERAPPIFRQCALEVSSLDLPWLTSRRENWIIGAVVFVDPAGAPGGPAGGPQGPRGPVGGPQGPREKPGLVLTGVVGGRTGSPRGLLGAPGLPPGALGDITLYSKKCSWYISVI